MCMNSERMTDTQYSKLSFCVGELMETASIVYRYLQTWFVMHLAFLLEHSATPLRTLPTPHMHL